MRLPKWRHVRAMRHGPWQGTKTHPNQFIFCRHSCPSSGCSGTVPVVMSDKVELPKKKATTNSGKLETEHMPPATPRKRKSGRAADREPLAHEAGRVAIHAEPTSKSFQGRRSDRELACFCQPLFAEKDCSCTHPINCARAPTSEACAGAARTASDVHGHAS